MSFASIITFYRKFAHNPKKFELISFIWCADENEMQQRYSLDEEAARKQIRAQIISKRLAYAWHALFCYTIAVYIIKFAIENPNKKFGIFFVLKLVLYFLLFLIEQASLLRTFLIFSELNLSAIYFSNLMKTMVRQIETLYATRSADERSLNRKLDEHLVKYNEIIRNQKLINRHCENTFYAYFVYTTFTVNYPVTMLFESSTFLIVSNFVNYLMIVFVIFFPPIYFNSMYFVESNMNFIKTCHHISRQLKSPMHKLKLINTYTLNPDVGSISFNFKHFMNYSTQVFIFVSKLLCVLPFDISLIKNKIKYLFF